MSFKDVLIALAIPALCSALPAPHEGVQPIVGGTTADAGDFPYIISMQKNGQHYCGGSLVNADTVVTAAHCAVGEDAANFKVRVGSLKYNDGGQLVQVTQMLPNPAFNATTMDNDVAILKLAANISESYTVKYATLPYAGFTPADGTVLTTAGWGATSEGNFTTPVELRKVDVPVVNHAECETDYTPEVVPKNQFCAAEKEGGKDSCQGDSGGPIADQSTNTLVGLVSWGDGCAEKGKPGIYTNIGDVMSYITANM